MLPDIQLLGQLVDKFQQSRVLVIGDIMWDEYIHGEVNRISPEAPVPVVLVKEELRTPGGAANVLKNLTALGVQTGIVGLVGNDDNGKQMIADLKSRDLAQVSVFAMPDRPTTIKTRIIARQQQLLRIDREEVKALPPEIETQIIAEIRKIIRNYQAVVLSDYDKGFFSPTLITEIIRLARENNLYLAVDPQVRHFKRYKHASTITPNEKEASGGMHAAFPANNQQIIELGRQIKEELDLQELLITRSERGMALFDSNHRVFFIPTIAQEVYDVTGAGDTVIAVYAAAIAAGGSSLQAALLANIAGGIVVGKFGAATVSQDEIKKNLHADHLLFTES